ncbi:uncharacterized protein [Ambystoma mexicanum]
MDVRRPGRKGKKRGPYKKWISESEHFIEETDYSNTLYGTSKKAMEDHAETLNRADELFFQDPSTAYCEEQHTQIEENIIGRSTHTASIGVSEELDESDFTTLPDYTPQADEDFYSSDCPINNHTEDKAQLLAEITSLRAENRCLKEQLQATQRINQLAIHHLQASLAALTSTDSFPESAEKLLEMVTTTSTQEADMQQLVKDANDPTRFKHIIVSKRELYKLLERAKASRDGASFLLNGVSELLFSPNEFAAAKGLTAARAGRDVLDVEKVDALHEFLRSVCKANRWPTMDYRVIKRKLATKICNARRGLKKTAPSEMQNG